MGRTGRNSQDPPLCVAGRYRLVERLGTGGMSVVWRGFDEILGRPVAVKVLSPRLADDQTFRDRLRQEALAAARLSHPHITGIFDFGEAPLSGRLTLPYVVMELNDGESVAARLTRRGPLPWPEAVRISAEVASALAVAHAGGVVHRDVTPANVMLTPTGAKVVDFGISAIVGERDAAPDGSLLGTPAYLAPERLSGAQVTAATDVYALGLLLYRQLTGHLPWPAETTAEALRAHLYAAPDPLPALSGMPPVVADVCLRCLAKSPAARPSAADAAHALAAAVGLHPIVPPARSRPPDAEPPIRAAAPVTAPRRSPTAAATRLRIGLLRVGLRVGARLGLGRPRPLGGGLFAGGGLVRRVLAARGPRHGRHPLRATLVSLALVAAAGASWAATRESPAVEQAQAAGAAPVTGGAAVRTRAACAVRYQIRRDWGSGYEALLTVATTDEVGRAAWRVQFTYAGSQRLTEVPRTVTQKGRKVVAKGSGTFRTFTLRGAYRGYNPLPLSFALDGRQCQVEVLGGTTTGRRSREPASRESASRESASRESASREPVSREPVSREPVSREPVSREPAGRGPVSEAVGARRRPSCGSCRILGPAPSGPARLPNDPATWHRR